MCSISDKPKFKNKNRVIELRDSFSKNKLRIDELPKDVLTELFVVAVERIDEKENGGEHDERDWKDCLCDKEFIIDELFERLQEKVNLGIYE